MILQLLAAILNKTFARRPSKSPSLDLPGKSIRGDLGTGLLFRWRRRPKSRRRNRRTRQLAHELVPVRAQVAWELAYPSPETCGLASGRFAEGQGFGDPSISYRKRLEPGGEFEPRPREIKSLIEQSCRCTVGLQRSVSSSSRNPAGRCRLILTRGWRKPASNRTGPASSRLSLAG
jgi:hypothetical protein